MPSIEVEIDDFTRPLLLDAFNNRLAKVRSDIERLETDIENLKKEESKIGQNLTRLGFTEDTYKKEKGSIKTDDLILPGEFKLENNGIGFNKNWGWLSKAKYIVENLIEGEINSNTVADKLVELQPELDRVTVYKNVSGDLGKLASGDNPILIRERVARGFAYKLIQKQSDNQTVRK